MEPNWWNGLILKMTSRRTFEFCRSATLISPTSAPKAKDSLPWTPWSRCRLSGRTRWSGGKLEVAGGRPGEPGEPRGRVRGGRLQPASQPVGQDRAARERNAWKVTTDQDSLSFRFSLQLPPIYQVGAKSCSWPCCDSMEAGTCEFQRENFFFSSKFMLERIMKRCTGNWWCPQVLVGRCSSLSAFRFFPCLVPQPHLLLHPVSDSCHFGT